jgi:hypothetical protein
MSHLMKKFAKLWEKSDISEKNSAFNNRDTNQHRELGIELHLTEIFFGIHSTFCIIVRIICNKFVYRM